MVSITQLPLLVKVIWGNVISSLGQPHPIKADYHSTRHRSVTLNLPMLAFFFNLEATQIHSISLIEAQITVYFFLIY